MRILAIAVLLVLASAARGDAVRILDDPRDALQARIDLMQQAGSEINAVYFLARNDRVTLTALALLREAERRGVTSRLVVDATFHHIPKAMAAHLHDEGVEIREYHPLSLRHPLWIFRRMHEKFIVADNARYITGGRNLGEAYFGMARKNYIDRDVYVDGASAIVADAHFERLWSSGEVVSFRASVPPEEKHLAATRLDVILEELRAGDAFAALDTGRNWSEGLKDIEAVQFLHDPVLAADGPRVRVRLAEIVDAAQHSIVIETPYLIPSTALLTLFEKKRREGVQIRILTNSLRSTDGVIPFAAYLRYRRRLLRAGIDIREYKGPDALHAKSAVIDGRVVLVGSYNLSHRSERLNAEAICVAEDEDLAREILASIDARTENAWNVAERERRSSLRERVSRTRSWGVWAARPIALLIEGQL